MCGEPHATVTDTYQQHANIYHPCKLYLQKLLNAQASLWLIKSVLVYLLLMSIYILKISMLHLNLCGSRDFSGISECGLICLVLSFDLLYKTLFFIQGKWEGIGSGKVFDLTRRTDS